jgi:hypothetical protein
MTQIITFSFSTVATFLVRIIALLMLTGLSWQGAQAQVIITMEDVPGKAAPTTPLDSEAIVPQHTLIQAPDIRLSSTAAGLVIEMPQEVIVEETEVLDITGRRLAVAVGDYQQATLRSTESRIALIRWRTKQGVIVRKVRL